MGVLADSAKLIFACAGIFFSFSYFAVLQEDVYKKDYGGEKFAFTFFALLVERGINAAVALLGILVLGGSGVKIPYMQIFNSGVSQVLAMAASNEALRYVSYPTQVRRQA
jgi:UDP-galactose transporter B1